jgi:hypothetical protein
MKKYYSDITGSNPADAMDSLLRKVQRDNHLSYSNGWSIDFATLEARYKNGKKMKLPTFFKRGGFFVIKIRKKGAFFDNYYQDKTQYRRLNRFTDEYEVAGAVYKSGGKWKAEAEVEHNQFEE